MKDDETEFERRTRSALQQSADSLDGATRSKLTQARHAALAAAERRPAWLDLRTLAPAGAVAVAVLASLFVLNQGGDASLQNAEGGAFDDIELLADNDAFELSEEEDLEFIEWAAAMNRRDYSGHVKPHASLLACALAFATLPASTAESKIDPELLEFLGAFESEDEDFLDFLEQRPVDKPPAKKPEAAARPADPKQVKKP